MLGRLVDKDFKLKYRRSALGVAWSLLSPVLSMVVMVAVFSTFMRYADPSIGNYPVYLILGNTAFSLMSEATSTGMSSVIAAAPLLKKVRVSRIVFPLQKVLSAGLNYAFALVAILLVMLFEGVPLTASAIWLLPAVLLLMLFSLGLSLLLSALSVFFRDVMHLWGVALTAWTYATPLFYPFSILPEGMQAAEALNPMYTYVTLIRDAMLWDATPDAGLWLSGVAAAAVSLAVGYAAFRKCESRFILYI